MRNALCFVAMTRLRNTFFFKFKHAVSGSNDIASNDTMVTNECGLESMWKATVVACLKECLHNSSRRSEKAVKNVRVIGVQPRFKPNTLLHGTNKF